MDEDSWFEIIATASPLWWEIPIALIAYGLRTYLALNAYDKIRRGISPTEVRVTEYETAFLSKTGTLQWVIAHRAAMADATWYWLLAAALYATVQHFGWLNLEVRRDWGGLAPWLVLLILHAIYRAAAAATGVTWSSSAVAATVAEDFNRTRPL